VTATWWAAEAVYKAGLQQFPDSAYLHIAYSSFLTHQRGTLQASSTEHSLVQI